MINLTKREREVLNLIAYEHTTNEIASQLFISDHTAKSHRKNLLKKLSVKNIAGLVRRGFELGLLNINDNKGYYSTKKELSNRIEKNQALESHTTAKASIKKLQVCFQFNGLSKVI